VSKILITGAAGLIGVHFSKYLLDKGYDIIGVDNLSGGYIDFVDNRLLNNRQFHELDINDDLTNIFQWYKPDIIYHFAAYAAEGLSPFIRKFNYINNVLGSVNIINHCIKYDVKKIIFTSSMCVYGIGNPPFKEDQDLKPIDPYGIAKYTIEQDLRCAYEQFGLNYTIIRPHNIIGIYQNIWDKYRNVIGIWINRILNNEPILIYGDGVQERAFSDIQYYMKPFELVMDNFNTETFNIGADKHYTLLTMANILKDIAKKYNYKCIIEHVESRHEVKLAYSDHSKAKEMLNFEDNTDVYALLEEMFLWAIKQPKREVKYMTYEIEKNIYSYWK
jgi:UDP-glucose 4-epimerase